ncbi:MAG TPA: NmrA family transcriptional regulator [Chryseolinea sp.]|nr:NmrA family transcriptional regulator [Chryseolinea sp.]
MSTTISPSKKKILVLGATGKTGSRIIQRLTNLNWPVQHGSRSSTPPFDWEIPATWRDAVASVHTVYISFQPDLAMPGAVETIRQFTQIAVGQGVKKIVLLSGRGEPEAQQCEDVVKEAGAAWTIVRASWFNQNFSEGNFLEPILAGHVALPAGNIGEPFIDADDIADVALAALTQDGHDGQLYEVTGPRLLTFEQAINEIAQATQRPIRYEQIPTEAYVSSMRDLGLPDNLISLITYLFAEVLDGRNAYISDGVERALGRKATDFSEYVRKTLSSGVWGNQVPI